MPGLIPKTSFFCFGQKMGLGLYVFREYHSILMPCPWLLKGRSAAMQHHTVTVVTDQAQRQQKLVDVWGIHNVCISKLNKIE